MGAYYREWNFFGKEQGAKQYFLIFLSQFFNNFLSYVNNIYIKTKDFLKIFIIEQNPVNYTINDSASQISWGPYIHHVFIE